MIGYESEVINSQLVNVAPAQAFNPLVFGRAYVPVGAWPRQGVYNVPPVLPPGGGLAKSMAPASYGGIGSYGVTPSSVSNEGSPWSIKQSPLLWAVAFLIISLFMLHMVHYKG